MCIRPPAPAATTAAPIGIARDRRSGTVTGVETVLLLGRSGTVTWRPPDDSAVTTFAQTALAIATVAGLSLVLLAISVALASVLLLLVALGFAVLGAVFVRRLLRL